MLQRRNLGPAISLVAVLMPASAAVGEEVADIGASYSTTIEINGEIDEYECCTPVRFTDESSPEGGVTIFMYPAWDEQFLYFLTMMDDTYLNARVESDDDAGALEEDCFQIFLDPDYSRDAVMQDDDYRIAVTVWDYVLDGSGWDNWEWDAGLTHALTRIATVNDNDDVDQGGSFIELGIPWSVLGVEPEQGTGLGILFGTTDLDPEGTPYTANHLGLEDPNRPESWARLVLEGSKVSLGPDRRTSPRRQIRGSGLYRKVLNGGTRRGALPPLFDLTGRLLNTTVDPDPRGVFVGENAGTIPELH